MSIKEVSRTRAALTPADCRRAVVMTAEDVKDYAALAALGINIGNVGQVRTMAAAFGMDDTQGLQTTASIAAPVQFLQTWLPGFTRTLTQARKVDDLIGLSIVGNWEDEEIVQGIMEPTAKATLYSDGGPVPLSSWNVAYERRSVVRFEQGINIGVLEEARAARMKVNTANEKRSGAGLALDILRNSIGFLGYNGGNNRTYGFLNDPSLPAYSTVANGASASPLWSSKKFLEITADIRSVAQALRTQMGDTFDPLSEPWTLAIATNVVEYLGVTSDFGISVQDWLSKTYKGCTVKSAPELNAANGGANVMYGYPETVNDGATDDSRVWVQLVPAKFQTIGVAKTAKGYVEDYSNACAGVMCKRPYAVVRRSGI